MTRADVVRAMDIMIGTINDTDIIEPWLMLGVGDGDITSDTTNEEIEEFGYTNDDTFKELMDLFIKLMYRARTNGIYFDGILSNCLTMKWE